MTPNSRSPAVTTSNSGAAHNQSSRPCSHPRRPHTRWLTPEEGVTDPIHCRAAAPRERPIRRTANRSPHSRTYCLSNTSTFSDFSPVAVVIFVFEVKVPPSLDTVRLVVPTILPPLFRVNRAVWLPTRLGKRVS